MKIPDWLPDQHHPQGLHGKLPRPPIQRILQPLVRFLHIESASGLVLLGCAVAALILANSPLADPFEQLWKTRIGFTIGGFTLEKPLLLWVNDALMSIFFFVVGLEIKREIIYGELRDPRKAALPVAAALGGMLVPAAIYMLFPTGPEGSRGWGIPMATDIAFVVGFLALLGPRVPLSLKILLLTLAIADDLGAVLIIAIAYTSDLTLMALGIAVIGLAVVRVMRNVGIRSIPLYFLVGGLVWLAVLKSGVHPTVAGVILGLMTPADPWLMPTSLLRVLQGVEQQLRNDQPADRDYHEESVQVLISSSRETISPLDRLETGLHPWVAFGIMPIFALANAGVRVNPAGLSDPVALAVAAGLVLGKPLGILLFSWGAVRVGLARLPSGVTWPVMAGAGCLAGIGFTMSLFIAGLALEASTLEAGKIGTLLGSAISAAIGLTLLLIFLRAGSGVTEQKSESVQPDSA